MEVTIVSPHGYCPGVNKAIEIAKQAKKDHPDQDVYLLGSLVHNEDTIQELKEAGLLLLDEKEKDLLSHLLERKKGDVIVFSAHGHPEAYEELAKEKGLFIVDATCRYVKENLEFALNCTQPVVYVGVEGHLESEAFLANCPDAVFYEAGGKACHFLSLLAKKQAPILVGQTTLSDEEVSSALEDIRKLFPNAVKGKERCATTSLRQAALRNLPKDIDVLFVLGSKTSNNSLKLHQIALEEGFEAYLCLNLDEVKKVPLEGKRKAALCSGASTSNKTFEEVLNYLRSV